MINKWIKRSSLALLLVGGIGFGYYHYCCKLGIYDLVEERDKPFILDLFKKDWYWLVAEGVEFSPEYMLHNRVRNPYSTDPLSIKVMYKGQEPVGFVAYYKEKFYVGRILFLAVREEFRSKKYGSLMFNYAMDHLIKEGATKIRLVTRTTNYPAQKVYKNAGFTEESRDDGFVYFEYEVPK